MYGGYDGTCEELFFIIAGGALERGYNVLVFDGPGQGGALVVQKLPMRPDWENVVTPVVDYLFRRRDVDPACIALSAVVLAAILRRVRRPSSIGLLHVLRMRLCSTPRL